MGYLPFRALKVALSGRTSRTQRYGRGFVSLESEYQCLEDNVLTILAAEKNGNPEPSIGNRADSGRQVW